MAALKRARLLCLLLSIACVGTESPSAKATGGTLVISTGGDPDILVPALLSSVQAAQITDLIYDRLAMIGDSLSIVNDAGFTPQLADRWTWGADSLSIAFHINPGAKWHDGTPVRSSDVRFTFQSTTDSTLGSGIRPLVTNIDSVTTPDSATAVFWFHARSPQQFYDATFQMPIMPEHIWRGIALSAWRGSEPAKHPIGSGQYRFVRWVPARGGGACRRHRKLSRLAQTETRHLEHRSRLQHGGNEISCRRDRFLRGSCDPRISLRSPSIRSSGRNSIGAFPTPSRNSTFAIPPIVARPHPIFGNRELRRALTMATDRATLVRSVYDSLALPALGPTVRAYPTTDPNLAQIPFDLPRARQILDSLGWRDANGDGIRERNGRPLQFSLAVPGTSRARVRLAVLLQEQLRQAGAKVDVEQLDFPVLIERLRKRAFDAAIGQWNTQPSPGSVRGSWGTGGSRSTSGTNYGSYESPGFRR